MLSRFRRYLDGMLRYLRLKFNDKSMLHGREFGKWTTESAGRSTPQQENGYDCGVYVVLTADFISDDLPLTFNANHVTSHRLMMAAAIMRGRLLYPLF